MRIYARAFLCPRETPSDESKRRLANLNPGSLVQTAAKGTAGNELFLELLAAQTLQAQHSGSLLANKLEIDFLLRLAATTQIAKAIKEAGARPGEPYVLVVAGRKAVRVPSVLGGTELKRRALTTSELGRVERAALLNAQRA